MEAEKEKNWKEEKGKAIIDALADDGVTYGEAQAIIKAAEWELGKRRMGNNERLLADGR